MKQNDINEKEKSIYYVVYLKMYSLFSILQSLFIMKYITKCIHCVVYYKMYVLCIYFKMYLLCSILQNVFIMKYITKSIHCVVYYKKYVLYNILQDAFIM